MEKIYIDFDETLFDTNRFYKDFLDICLEYGIEKETVNLAKDELFNEKSLFNMEIIVNYLTNRYNLSNKFLEDVNQLFSSKYVYDDVIPCLEKLKSYYELIILSYGNYKYQISKINGSDLKKYFNNIIITDKNKSTLDNVDYKNSIFIDNNPEEIKRFLEVGSKKVIRIRRDSDKYSKKELDVEVNVLEYENFFDILKNEFSI